MSFQESLNSLKYLCISYPSSSTLSKPFVCLDFPHKQSTQKLNENISNKQFKTETTLPWWHVNLNIHLINKFLKEYERWTIHRDFIRWSYGKRLHHI